MALEIERKFLLRSDAWRAQVSETVSIRDGLLLSDVGGKLRVRIQDNRASLAFKGPRIGFSRQEYEYSVPLEEAEEMMVLLARGRILSKRRSLVAANGLVWEVDEYAPPLQDVTLAEVELPSEAHPLILPDWVGEEITGDPAWRKSALLARALARTATALAGVEGISVTKTSLP